MYTLPWQVAPELFLRTDHELLGICEGTLRYRAPGRVNLIGEHTDYNDGFVMPVAIDRFTTVTATPRADRLLVATSRAYPNAVTIDLDAPGGGPTGAWSDYVRGVAAILERRGWRLTGADLTIDSNVPMGAGLSSSAALEVSTGYALMDIAGHAIDRTQLALACQQAEQEFAGTRCGLMDQFIACYGRAGQALFLDTRSLHADWLPLPADVQVVVCNTMTKHALASDGYNDRRADCEAGVRALSARMPGIHALRDVTLPDLERHRDIQPERVFHRCRHVVTENARVESAAAALQSGHPGTFGALMSASHQSLRDDYEVSTPELDAMVEIAMQADGVFGARLTGGGFGGCTVNLVRTDAVTAFVAHVTGGYRARTGLVPEIHICVASEGVGPSGE